jgi:citrate synthase
LVIESKNFDPRAKIIKKAADELETLGVDDSCLAKIRLSA